MATSAASARHTITRRAYGLLRVAHPVPSVAYVVAVGVFAALAAVAAHRTLDPGKLARVLVAMGCAQAAIGATNDLCDQSLDALSRPEKPLVRGLIAPEHALLLAVIGSAALLLLLAPLGPLALLLGLLVEGLGLAYDFGLKRTPWSGLLYAVYFPLIPLLAWTVFGRWQPFLLWIVPLGAALGLAMNVSNSLPDLEADLAHGVRGLPHRLGLRRGLRLTWATPPLVVALLWLLDLARVVPARPVGMWLATAFALASPVAAWWLYRARPGTRTLRTTFYIQALGVVGLGAAWLAAVAF